MAYRCKSVSLVAFPRAGGAVALPMYCRRWQCPHCGKYQRRRLKRRLMDGNPTTFLTLTVNPNVHPDPDEAFKQASLAINRLMKVLRRHYPRHRIEYGLVWEKTKKGYPHAHLLLRAPFIPQAFLSRTWERLSGAPVVDIRMVRTEGEAAAYVSKYLTKDPAVPAGYRRFRLSHAYSAAPPKGALADLLSVDEWLRVHAPLDETLVSLTSRGFRFQELKPELWISRPP